MIRGWDTLFLVLKLLRDPRNLLTALSLIFLVASWVTHLELLAYFSFLFGGAYPVLGAIETAKSKKLDVDILMVIAAVGSLILDRPNEGATLFFLFSLSHALEHYTMDKTRSAIESLMQLRPSTAWVIREGQEIEVPVEEVKIGDHLIIRPQSQVPLDGTILSGSSSLDQSAVSGESIPVSKSIGDSVVGGTLNLEGGLVIVAESTVEDSTLTKIMNLVADAQVNKASGERVSTWFGERYTWFVLLSSIGLLLYKRFVAGQGDEALYSALTLLVALSPCALVISTPASTLSALNWAARNGLLIRGGRFIELAADIDTIAMDKTGTLTRGKPELVEICLCDHVAAGESPCADGACWRTGDSFSGEAVNILRYAAAVEQYSDHPIAQAIVRAARRAELDIPEATELRVIPAKGVAARVNGVEIAVGKPALLEEVGNQVPDGFFEHAKEMAAQGMTVALLSFGDEFAALGLRDEPRTEAKEALSLMREVGVTRLMMLTGDNPQTAAAVAEPLNLDLVQASLLPANKTEIIMKEVAEGRRVMMVGDGINDAPSLAAAQVGVAMGGLGSDIALNAADVVLMHDNLKRIPDLIRLGKRTRSIIQTNLIFAGGVIAVLAVLSLFGKLPLPFAVFGHEGSTVLVILNGLTLMKGPPK